MNLKGSVRKTWEGLMARKGEGKRCNYTLIRLKIIIIHLKDGLRRIRTMS